MYNQPVSKNSGLKPPGVFLTGRQNDYDDDSDDDDDNNTDDDDGVGGGGGLLYAHITNCKYSFVPCKSCFLHILE